MDEIQARYVRSFLAQGNVQGAYNALTKMGAPEDSDYLYVLLAGEVLFHKQDRNAAVTFFKEAERLRPNSHVPSLWLAALYDEMNNQPAAVAAYKSVIRKNPGHHVATRRLTEMGVPIPETHIPPVSTPRPPQPTKPETYSDLQYPKTAEERETQLAARLAWQQGIQEQEITAMPIWKKIFLSLILIMILGGFISLAITTFF